MANLKEVYDNEIHPQLQKELGLTNVMEVPRITKITLNMGVGEAIGDRKQLDAAVADLEAIAGQKVVITKARKSIANFKVRDGWPIGCKVTLRKARMYEFLDRLINIAIPRQRDFRGISPRSFDGRGNFSMGFTEQIVFPEINYDKIDKIRGLNISITTTAKTDDQARALLRAFNFPLRELGGSSAANDEEPSAEVVEEPSAEVVEEPSAEVVEEPSAEVAEQPEAEAAIEEQPVEDTPVEEPSSGEESSAEENKEPSAE